ncbi:MAG: c-type cytochrome [Rhodothermales bacterium]|nr:c-type cytochrome [Rhodothermales bacterium]
MLRRCLLPLLVLPFLLPTFTAQAQRLPENLQVFPKDTPRSELIPMMRDFSFATGLRCEGCHYDPVGEGNFRDIEFASDANPMKEKARFMIRMTRNLNEFVLPMVPNRSEPGFQITCKTCHRGQAKPLLLGQDLLMTVHESGVDSAAARYRFLRSNLGMRGAFDFGEWETNELAAELVEEGRVEDAIVIYELNADFHPESAAIQGSLGQLYEETGDTEAAIRAYEKALELGAPARLIQSRLDELKGGD